jgi:signal transduction histidine kinase
MEFSLLQVSVLFNVLGILITLLTSCVGLWILPRPFFKYHFLNYIFITVSIVMVLLITTIKETILFDTLLMTFYALGGISLYRCLCLLSGQPTKKQEYLLIGLAFFVAPFGLYLWGYDIYVIPIPTVYAYAFLNLMFAIQCFITIRKTIGTSALFLGFSLMAVSVVETMYPFIGTSPFAYIGYFGAGFSHIFIGIGMLLVLLQKEHRFQEQQLESMVSVKAEKDLFFSKVTHELRIPITVLKGLNYLWMDKQTSIDEHQSMYVEQVDRLERLVTEILDIAKVEVDQVSVDLNKTSVLDFFNTQQDAWQLLFTASPVKFNIELELDPLHLFVVDTFKLSQAIGNLLSNAIKYSPDGGTVTLKAFILHQEVFIQVLDQGPGLKTIESNATILPFDSFHTLSNKNTQTLVNKPSGTGLGLTIVQQTVLKHNGLLTFKANKPQGALVEIRLKLLT